MSVSYCLGDALRIARLPVEQWADQIAELPSSCGYADCTAGGCCQTTVRDYLAMQYRCHCQREGSAQPGRRSRKRAR